jgi:hypothetical protein
MTRILHLTATANGAPWMVALAQEQKRLGHDVEVILPSLEGTIAPALEREGIRCHTADDRPPGPAAAPAAP